MRTGQQISHKYHLHKALVTNPNIRNLDETKGTRCVLYSLVAVHEEAGDEGAHAQPVADIIRLRYKDTSLSMSIETTRALPKTESWMAAWLEFFFRSTLSFFSTSGTKTEEQLARRGTEQTREVLWW
jgi:hypothetical protein